MAHSEKSTVPYSPSEKSTVPYSPRAGADLVKALAATKQLSLLDARQLVEKAGISEEAGFHALLFAMQKEGSLRRVGERLEGV